MSEFFYNNGLRYKEEIIEERNNKVIIRDKKRGIKVICEKKLFLNIRECEKYYKISDSAIVNYLNGKTNMPKFFYDNGLRYEYETIEQRNDRIIKSKKEKKKIVCENIVFDSITECANKYKVTVSLISKYLIGKTQMPQKWKLQFVK